MILKVFFLNMMLSNVRKARIPAAITETSVEIYMLGLYKFITNVNQIFIPHEILFPF